MKVGFVYTSKVEGEKYTVTEVSRDPVTARLMIRTDIIGFSIYKDNINQYFKLDILASFRNLIEQHRDKI